VVAYSFNEPNERLKRHSHAKFVLTKNLQLFYITRGRRNLSHTHTKKTPKLKITLIRLRNYITLITKIIVQKFLLTRYWIKVWNTTQSMDKLHPKVVTQ
jgi:hypothetical protein